MQFLEPTLQAALRDQTSFREGFCRFFTSSPSRRHINQKCLPELLVADFAVGFHIANNTSENDENFIFNAVKFGSNGDHKSERSITVSAGNPMFR